MTPIEPSVQQIFAQCYGKPFCRLQVRPNRSISIGFGEKCEHHDHKLRDKFYGQWEIGSFHANWRLAHAEKVILSGSSASLDHNAIEQSVLQWVQGSFTQISMLTEFDLRIHLSTGVVLDFFSLEDLDDETFHVFAPNDLVAFFHHDVGWKIEPSRR